MFIRMDYKLLFTAILTLQISLHLCQENITESVLRGNIKRRGRDFSDALFVLLFFIDLDERRISCVNHFLLTTNLRQTTLNISRQNNDKISPCENMII